MEQKNGLHKSQLDNLNKQLEKYKQLSPEVQAKVRRDVIKEVNFQRNQFRKKLALSKAELKKLNLILGATGAGKSTLFNYLNLLPLIIKEGVDANGNKNQIVKLDVDKSKVSPDTMIAPIGHGFVSETTIPNFSKSRSSDVTYVDCAGEFDSRDILQSIINSYFKYQLAMEAEMVKLTIAINYNDIHTNRGTIFKQILKEVGNFIGLWENFLNSESISLVITGVDPSIKNAKGQIVQTVKEISDKVKDLGLFKQILQNISKREAIAIFLAPTKKCKLVQNQDGEEVPQYTIPQGEPYKANAKICSPELISKTLEQTRFMKCQPGLFLHNLQNNAQYLVNAICEGIINEIKQEVMNTIITSAINKNQNLMKQKKPITAQQFDSQKQLIKAKINSLSGVKNIAEIIKIFEIKKQFLQKYQILCQDLNEFLKISNIPNIQNKILEVAKDITIYLREKIQIIDKDTLIFINKQCQSMQNEISVLKDQQKKAQDKRIHELKVMQEKAKIQRQNRESQRKIKIMQMKNNVKMKEIQSKNQTNKLKIQTEARKDEKQLEIDARKGQMQVKILQIKQDHQLKIQQNEKTGTFVGMIVEAGEKIIDVGGKILDKTAQLVVNVVAKKIDL